MAADTSGGEPPACRSGPAPTGPSVVAPGGCYHKRVKIFGILAAIFIVVPVVEFALLIEVGKRLGTLETLLLVFGTGIAGAWLARLEGFRILYHIRRDLDAGRVPAEGVLDGVLVLVAGIALIMPGLLTDAAGLLLLFPPTRYPIKAFIRRRAEGWASHRRIEITPL